MVYAECEKCKKRIEKRKKAEKEILNNLAVFTVAIFTVLITDGLSFLPYSGLIFFFMICLFCIWCLWFINKNNLYIRVYDVRYIKKLLKVVKKSLKTLHI